MVVLGHVIILFLIPWETSRLISTVAVLVYTSPLADKKCKEHFLFMHTVETSALLYCWATRQAQERPLDQTDL